MRPPSLETMAVDSRFAEMDQAMRCEDAERARRLRASAAGPGRVVWLPQLLRYIGATILCTAAFTFMVQNWHSGNDVGRYFLFLGFTLMLSAAGFLCGLRIREERGARTFLGLAAASVPAHFTVLGALVYSRFPWLSGFADYPAYARFTAPDGVGALVALALGSATLLPLVWMAFLAYARHEAPRLTLVYLLSNAALAIPTRHPDLIAGLVLLLLAGLVWFDRRVLHPAPAMRTREGYLVRVMLALPLAVLIVRSLHLYPVSPLLGAGMLASLAFALFEVAPRHVRHRPLAALYQHVSLLPALGAWVLVGDALDAVPWIGSGALLPLVCLPAALSLALMSLRALEAGERYRALAALVALGGSALNLVLFPGVASAFVCLLTAILATACGYVAAQREVVGLGLLALVYALVHHVRLALDLYGVSPWTSLALLGTLTVLVASLLERQRKPLLARAAALRSRIRGSLLEGADA